MHYYRKDIVQEVMTKILYHQEFDLQGLLQHFDALLPKTERVYPA